MEPVELTPQQIMRQVTPAIQPVPLYLSFIIHTLFRDGLPHGWGK